MQLLLESNVFFFLKNEIKENNDNHLIINSTSHSLIKRLAIIIWSMEQADDRWQGISEGWNQNQLSRTDFIMVSFMLSIQGICRHCASMKQGRALKLICCQRLRFWAHNHWLWCHRGERGGGGGGVKRHTPLENCEW